MSQNIFKTTLRLNLENDEERRAWEHLQNMDRTQYKSYSQAVVAAVNSFFDRREKVPGPFLESQEREDAFLRKVEDTVMRCLSAAKDMNVQPVVLQPSSNADLPEQTVKDEMDTMALEFINGL